MENPFVFGRIASGKSFTNRKEEIKHLVHNFASGINTIIISPRRWGKSSLIIESSRNIVKKKLVFCFLDLYNIRSEHEFYNSFAKTVLQASSSKWEEWVNTAKKNIRRIIPSIHLGNDPHNDFSISFDWQDILKDPGELLNLPEAVCIDKKIQMVVCIDEFQNISLYDESLQFQQRMRSVWQHHEHVSYCIYGSKQHMMAEVFENRSMPFYKFGEVLFINKINSKEWISYIKDRFEQSGKQISPETAGYISSIMDNHPYFVQQLAATSWRLSDKICINAIVDKALEELIVQQNIFFRREIDNLTMHQINFLKALCSNAKHFTSLHVLNEFKLGSSSNVARLRKALVQKEILDIRDENISFIDPLFKIWFTTKYMKV